MTNQEKLKIPQYRLTNKKASAILLVIFFVVLFNDFGSIQTESGGGLLSQPLYFTQKH